MNTEGCELKPLMTLTIPIYEIPCECRVIVNEKGECLVRKIYEGNQDGKAETS